MSEEAEATEDTPETEFDSSEDTDSSADESESEEEGGVDTVYVGNKTPMKYVQAAMTSFNQGNQQVVLKSRGRAISTAVDTAEILRREFMEDVDIEDIEISTEEIEDDDGEEVKLSSMRITME
ncbi:MAG: DNA-binding protein Alba [Halobacteria archaeon]|nr:DNA-binding protein Alba [Halobacteria archaeon]